MPLEILTGNDVPSLLKRARTAVGSDAVVVSVRRVVFEGRLGFEMVAADPVTAAGIERTERTARRAAEPPAPAPAPGRRATPNPTPVELWTNPLAGPRPANGPAKARDGEPDAAALLWSAPAPQRPAKRWPWTRRERPVARRPVVIALVGPTGAGKTTTLAKLATHPLGFGGRRVALLCLDTYRVGGVEQLRQYGELARLSVEVAHDARDAERAAQRLAGHDVVLVDTAGRGPAADSDMAASQAQLLALAPDEVHLVVPAGLSANAARSVASRHLRYGVTHVLATKLDEFPGDRAAFDVAGAFGWPMRWITDGQEVPADLELAPGAGRAARSPLEVA